LSSGSTTEGRAMNEVEFIRTLVARNPNIRGSTILHRLEKRRKLEELREERERRDAFAKEAEKPSWSPFLQWLGKRS
jgi:hypothetical protein